MPMLVYVPSLFCQMVIVNPVMECMAGEARYVKLHEAYDLNDEFSRKVFGRYNYYDIVFTDDSKLYNLNMDHSLVLKAYHSEKS